MTIQNESELYTPIKSYLEKSGYIVKGEVSHCDLVAFHQEAEKNDEPIIVELKKQLNLAFLVQGMRRQTLSQTVYLAVPEQKIKAANQKKARSGAYSWKEAAELCRRTGLGLITVRFYQRRPPVVTVWCDPEPVKGATPAKPTKKQIRLRNEFYARHGDFNVGGSHRVKQVTSYRQRALICAHFMRDKDEVPVKEIRELTEDALAGRLLRDDHYGWFQRVRRGVYTLTPEGRIGLEQFQYVVDSILDLETDNNV